MFEGAVGITCLKIIELRGKFEMPISLYNGQAFVLENMEDLDRSQLMVFFLNGHREDIIVLQDKNGEYTGCISYGSLLFC